jgi:hypothetical protein
VTTSRHLADYVLRTRSGQVAVSPPVPGGGAGAGRITMGFSAPDANTLRSLTGQDAVLVRNIQRPGEALARVRLLAVDPRTSRLVAEVMPGGVPLPPPPAPTVRQTRAGAGGKNLRLLIPGVVLGLIVLGAIALTLQSPVDRRCSTSMDCPVGFACASWPGPAGENYRSCERTCLSDGDCPGSEQCSFIEDGPHVVRVCRSSR